MAKLRKKHHEAIAQGIANAAYDLVLTKHGAACIAERVADEIAPFDPTFNHLTFVTSVLRKAGYDDVLD